jgi:glycosyltransferase involved in cell wall biosynthesis
MKIAFILPSLANKGPIIMANDLIGYLLSQDYRCDVYYFDRIEELVFPCKTTPVSFFEKINFREYDIIHSHLFRPDLYCAIHKMAIKKAGVKVITTIHTAIYDDLTYTYGKFISRLIIPVWIASWKRADHVVLLTDFAKSYYSKLKFSAQTVINNGRDIPPSPLPIPPSDYDLIAELKKKYILLGTVCAMDKRKGLAQIIPLLVLNQNYAFLIVGDGDERAFLEAMAIQYGVSSRFKVIGFRENGFRYLSYLNLFVMPSRSEGMSLALLEAIALKIPIVCADIPAISHELSDNEVSFFKLDDEQSLNDACKWALQNSEEISNNAFVHYANRYTVALMGGNYNELYQLYKK